MKCEVCKRKTDWDSSFGQEEFIVCRKCAEKMGKEVGDFKYVLRTIFQMGEIRQNIIRERKATKNENN